MKNEVVLVLPGPTGFFLRGIYFNEFLYDKFVSKLLKLFRGKEFKYKAPTPLSILAVGTSLKNNGFIPRLVDGRCENIRKKLNQYIGNKTLFVGISAMTSSQIIFGLKTAKHVRKIAPHIPIVWGGLHATVLPEETLSTSDYVDIVCRREGEVTAVELAEAIQRNKPLKNIKGVSYKDEKGNIVNNEDRDFINFNELPPLNYGLLNPDLYDLSYVTYQASRGCPHKCKFCEVGPIHKGRYRTKSAQVIINDIENIVKSFSTKEIDIIDENFFVNLKKAREFANSILDKNLRIRWRAMCRADYFEKTDVDFWKLMKRSGCRFITVGAESGSQKTLDSIKKDITISDIINAASQMDKASIKGSLSFICGFPDEDINDMKKTVSLADHLLKNYKHISIFEIFAFMCFPMTPFYEEVKNRGCEFPQRLKDWGNFLFNDIKYIKWHPLHNYVFKLSTVSKWTVRPKISRILSPLKRLDIISFLIYFCGYTCNFRWKYKYFGFPLDIYMQYWINKYCLKYSWQK